MERVVGEFEGTLVKETDPFPYLMLVAFEASGPIRFALLLLVWPIVHILELLGLRDAGFKLAVFVAVAGVRMSEIEYVGRAVMPKFYMDHIDLDAWRVFSKYGQKIVLSKSPRVIIEWFAQKHLGADQVIGSELVVNRFGRATGFLIEVGSGFADVEKVFGGKQGCLGLGRPNSDIHFGSTFFMSLCEVQRHLPFTSTQLLGDEAQYKLKHPNPIIFHDGRLVMFPKPIIALFILLWIPIGVILAIFRMVTTLFLPSFVIPYQNVLYGVFLTIKGNPPKPVSKHDSSNGVLFVCNHRAFMDPVIVAVALGRKISAVSYSLSRVTEFFNPLRNIRLTRIREIDAKKIEGELKRGDTVIFAEGTTCREPCLFRFSALFAELTDRIVPVGLKYNPTLFHPSTARGWKGFDPFCFLVNPFSFYEVTFLDQLRSIDTYGGGKSSYDVANDVQRQLAVELGFECTNYTRKDKYMFLKGDYGRV